MFKSRKGTQEQKEFWVMAERLPKASPSRFYELLNRTLEEMDFAQEVWEWCAPAYAYFSRGGRPGIDRVVYFKMLMIGFFEGIESERQIAARCEDSLSLRGFLGYALEEATPDHSSMSIIRQRLGSDCFERVFALVLRALQRHGLLKGRHLGIDSSIIEANASLRSLSERNTAEGYWAYVQRLARETGVETNDGAALRNFDRHRGGKKLSNEQWQNPHDPDAKIGRTKGWSHGHGLSVRTHRGPGHRRDPCRRRCCRAITATAIRVQEAQADSEALPETLTADKGCFSMLEIGRLQEFSLKTVISDPRRAQRRFDKLSSAQRQTLARAARSMSSKYGRKLLRKRGQHIERSFAHVFDAGGMRRTTLRGLEKLSKRHQIAAACYNLSQLLRRLYGVGTPKQWAACLSLLLARMLHLLTSTSHSLGGPRARLK